VAGGHAGDRLSRDLESPRAVFPLDRAREAQALCRQVSGIDAGLPGICSGEELFCSGRSGPLSVELAERFESRSS
jgi:hypothetical protein